MRRRFWGELAERVEMSIDYQFTANQPIQRKANELFGRDFARGPNHLPCWPREIATENFEFFQRDRVERRLGACLQTAGGCFPRHSHRHRFCGRRLPGRSPTTAAI